jgi:hypothetical protein
MGLPGEASRKTRRRVLGWVDGLLLLPQSVIALPITFALQPGWGHGLLVWLGLSGAACLLDRLGQKEISMQRVD